jgi:hypothetical protein
MNREDIIRMAREAGVPHTFWGDLCPEYNIDVLKRFAALVAAAERERIIAANAPEIEKTNAYIKQIEQAVLDERLACAKLCDIEATLTIDSLEKNAMRWCTDAIRARGGEK